MDFLLYPDPAMLQCEYVQATAIAASTIVWNQPPDPILSIHSSLQITAANQH